MYIRPFYYGIIQPAILFIGRYHLFYGRWNCYGQFYITVNFKIIMMKYLKFLIAGILFGVILVKSQVVSWFRIQEMFRFQSFHMYGVIGCAIAVGIISIQLIKRLNI